MCVCVCVCVCVYARVCGWWEGGVGMGGGSSVVNPFRTVWCVVSSFLRKTQRRQC